MLQPVPTTITTKSLQRATRIAQELALPGKWCKGKRSRQPKYRADLKQRWQEWSERLIGLRVEITEDSWVAVATAQEICDSVNGVKPLPWRNLRGNLGVVREVHLIPSYLGYETGGVEVRIKFDGRRNTEFVGLAHCSIPT